MPFKSQSQRGYMYVHHPEIAKRWEKETPKGKLPEHAEGHSAEHMALKATKKKHLGVYRSV